MRAGCEREREAYSGRSGSGSGAVVGVAAGRLGGQLLVEGLLLAVRHLSPAYGDSIATTPNDHQPKVSKKPHIRACACEGEEKRGKRSGVPGSCVFAVRRIIDM
jgi:hypothetical protein